MSDNATALPSAWTVVPIVELMAPLADGRRMHHGWSPQCEREPVRKATDWGVLKTTAIQSGAFLSEHNKRLPESLSPRPGLEVAAGDLLLTCAGPRARCGVPCLVRTVRPRLILSGKMYRFRPESEIIEPALLEAYLRSGAAQTAIDAMKTGISDSGLNLTHERFQNLPVALPPRREQKRILDALESCLTRLDDSERLLERAQRNLERYQAAVLTAAVEGNLVPSEAERARSEGRDYEPATVLLEGILAESPKQGSRRRPGAAAADGTWLPTLPEGWCWVTVREAVSTPLTNGRSVRSASNGFPVLRLTSLRDGAVDLRERKVGAWTEEDAKPAIVSEGDFLVSRGSGSIRLVGIGGIVGPVTNPVAFPDTMIRFRLSPKLSARYFAYAWNSRVVRDQLEARAKTTAGIFKLNQGDLEACVLPLPPRAEQDRIVEELDRILSAARASAALNRASAARCSVLRQSVLRWAFEGRLVNQDPTDEPASAYLARIRAEREASATNPAKRRPRRKPKPRTP